MSAMQVSVLYFADCPNWADAGRRMRMALDTIGRDDVTVHFHAVETAEEAAEVGFGGSPTFMVDDVDLFGPPASTGSLTCRIYPTENGLSGVPTLAALVARLTERTGR
ncbi:hypothetical protein [Phytohabitans houttuyneae]|uniref:Thioredoxin family protein n=1 Tax=Phytohabitans houttuyneae TaxID=1076126 RepID=A0A6V8KSY1_9ACTN|nr:hypothetical protein [Phytohabitans houttuyneae]GFJ84917.1 hypothetical protein Phou_090970 [Phytohabitans houttuyneae]